MSNEIKSSSARRTAGSLKRGVMPPAPECGFSPEVIRNIRRHELLEHHGEPPVQKERLVDEILSTFQNAEKWPMTDAERIATLQKWYRMAQAIRETEAA